MESKAQTRRTPEYPPKSRIERCIADFEAEGRTVTARAVADETGIGERLVKHYLAILRGIMRSDVAKNRQLVLDSLAIMQEKGQAVSALAIAESTGLSRQAVSRHLTAYYGTAEWKGEYIREVYAHCMASGIAPTRKAVADFTGYSVRTVDKFIDRAVEQSPPREIYLFSRDVFFKITQQAMAGSYRHQLLYLQLCYGFSPKMLDKQPLQPIYNFINDLPGPVDEC